MDIFGTIGTSIDLALKIKSNCEQIGQNKDDGATLSSDIADSLAQIREFLERQPLSVPSELRDNLSEFENELMRILGRQQRLNKSSRNIVFTKFKEFYNADDVKNQLAELRLRIQICYQKLQLSSTIRTETNVSVISEHVVAIRQDQEATERKIHMILNALLPGGSDPNRNTLPAHSETISPVSAEVSPSSDLSHQNMQITRQIDSVPSMGNEKSTVLPAIEIERNYLKEKIKELANNIPSIRNQTMKQQTLSWLNPFREVAIWERDYTSSRTEEESIAETVRILRILRSEKRIAHADVAKELLYLASVLSKLGMWEEASIIYDRGIQICCELVKEGGAKVVMSLAGFILKTFSETAVHSKTADASGILDYIGTLRHQLKEQGQRDYLSRLALSLTNTSHEISHRGRFEASIKAEHEAILIYRYLTKANRYTHLPDLASSLHDLALDLSKLDRREDAINAVEEAVTLRQQLAARDPKIYLPGLIDSVRMLAVEVNNRGRYEDAVKIAKDGLENLQKLGDRSGRSDVPELISSMNSLLIELHDTKSEDGKQEGTKLGVVSVDPPDATNPGQLDTPDTSREQIMESKVIPLETSHEASGPSQSRSDQEMEDSMDSKERQAQDQKSEERAAGKEQPLMDDGREAHIRSLSMTLHNLAVDLSSSKRLKDALKAVEEAVELRRELIAKNRGAYISNLGLSLHNFALYLHRAGRYDEAVKAIREAVELRREFVDKDRKANLPDFSQSVHNLGLYLNKAGKHLEAIEAVEEAIQLRRELVEMDRDSYLSDLSWSLYNLAIYLNKSQRRSDAIKVAEEAAQLRRELVERNRKAYLPDLSISLHNLGIYMNQDGRVSESVRVIEEAIGVRRELVTRNRKTYLADLCFSLHNSGLYLNKATRPADAVKALEEAVELRRELVERDRKTHLSDLGQSVHNLGIYLNQMGRHDEAVKVLDEAVRLRRELVEMDRKTHLSDLAWSLHNMTLYLDKAGRGSEGVEAIEEAIQIRRELSQKDPDTYLPQLTTSLKKLSTLLQNSKTSNETEEDNALQDQSQSEKVV